MARQDPTNLELKHCIYGDHWTKDWSLKQHYCDPHWREYRRKQKYVHKHKPLLIAAQDGKCDICGKDFDTIRTSSIHVDHDHTEAFVIRGLLCINCNSVLGHAKDDIQVLERAIWYLQNRKGRPLDDVIESLLQGEGYSTAFGADE